MNDDANVRMKDLVMRGGLGQEGFYVRKGGLLGVLDGVDVRREKTNRNGDGAFPARSKLDARLVTVGGPCISTSAKRLDEYASQLKSLQSERESFEVYFDLPGKTVWGMGHVSDKPGFLPVKWGERANWDIELQFDDPVLFGEVRRFWAPTPGVSVIMSHRGNETSYPKYVVAGNLPNGYTLNGPGGLRYRSTLPVTVDHPHTIDMAENYLWRDGVMVFGRTPEMDTWGVGFGKQVSTSFTATAGTGTITVTVPDRWV
jgi:hypothetical protein